ncbi:hypothetical protein HYC85_016143 [Camellia sinensis]|uniref:Uncharacterized protein n=1 Tax=Camellia sinensis TaxID=4442 RepID=A0A7J7H040_CAMSI|nr:hypothetical protein HYC85_016143 [Camellia sinensis]
MVAFGSKALSGADGAKDSDERAEDPHRRRLTSHRIVVDLNGEIAFAFGVDLNDEIHHYLRPGDAVISSLGHAVTGRFETVAGHFEAIGDLNTFLSLYIYS